MRQFLRDYNEAYNATILLTSHYMADITALCERVLMIHEGNLIYDGSLDGVIEQFAPYREVKLEMRMEMKTGGLMGMMMVEMVMVMVMEE